MPSQESAPALHVSLGSGVVGGVIVLLICLHRSCTSSCCACKWGEGVCTGISGEEGRNCTVECLGQWCWEGVASAPICSQRLGEVFGECVLNAEWSGLTIKTD